MINNIPTYNITCPHCLKETPAQPINNFMDSDNDRSIYSICRCNLCNKIIFVKNPTSTDPENNAKFYKNEYEVYPHAFFQKSFSDEINSVSDKFQTIFNEAKKAESIGLDNICGLAYRRSLEFLIRDFACYLNPGKSDEIKNDNSFSNVIHNRIPDSINFQEIKDITKRAWWLGSDYAHYNKKYDDHDINDLKELIDIVVLNIESYIKTQKYKKQILKK